jgi:hypothetical protein
MSAATARPREIRIITISIVFDEREIQPRP